LTDSHGCEQLAQSWYLMVNWPGVELTTFQSRIQPQTTESPSHSLLFNNESNHLMDWEIL